MFKSINGGRLPERATKYSAGFDVFTNEDSLIGAGETKTIELGIVLDMDIGELNSWAEKFFFKPYTLFESSINDYNDFIENHYFSLHIRSSLRAKGLTSLGTGIIDMDYRDEIKMIIHNPITDVVNTEEGVYYNGADNCSPYRIKKGDKIGQLILCRHEGWLLPSEYTKDETRHGGFGSTGK